MPKEWANYTDQKGFLKIGTSLIEPSEETRLKNDFRIREDVYEAWILELDKAGSCEKFQLEDETYKSRYHTDGKQPAIENCLNELEKSVEYNYLGENFPLEYEECLKSVDDDKFHSLLTTFCLDAIAVRRLIIEHSLCCKNDSSVITSTICSYENFNTNYSNFSLNILSGLARAGYPKQPSVARSSFNFELFHSFFIVGFLIKLFFKYFL